MSESESVSCDLLLEQFDYYFHGEYDFIIVY